MNKSKTIQFYADPGHGWAKVKKSELEKLGIAQLISACSYERGEYAYLEEDCDLSRFLEAYCTYYGIDKSTFFKDFTKSIYAGHYAHIRDFASYIHISQ